MIPLFIFLFFSNDSPFQIWGVHQSLLTESKLVSGENLFRQKIKLIDHFLWNLFNRKPADCKIEIYLRKSLGNVAKIYSDRAYDCNDDDVL